MTDFHSDSLSGRGVPASARAVSLAHLTMIDADPIELIEAAAQAGFSHVGLRIVPPMPGDPVAPVLGDASLQRAIRQRLAATGLKVLDVEAFWLTSSFDAAEHESALALGADLGAQYLVVIGNDSHRDRTIDNFGALCMAAQRFGLKPAFEFIPYSQVPKLAAALDIVLAVRQPNAGLLIDALHLSRSGGSPKDIAGIPDEFIHFMHLCDAPLVRPATIAEMRTEAREDRLFPGEGELPLSALVAAAPASTPLAIEAPHRGHARLSFGDRGQLAREALRPFDAPICRREPPDDFHTRS
jgi:sugar phosphate isomerase/epimerase